MTGGGGWGGDSDHHFFKYGKEVKNVQGRDNGSDFFNAYGRGSLTVAWGCHASTDILSGAFQVFLESW